MAPVIYMFLAITLAVIASRVILRYTPELQLRNGISMYICKDARDFFQTLVPRDIVPFTVYVISVLISDVTAVHIGLIVLVSYWLLLVTPSFGRSEIKHKLQRLSEAALVATAGVNYGIYLAGWT